MPAIRSNSARRRLFAASCLVGLSLLSGCGKKPQAAPPPLPVDVLTIHTQPITRVTQLPGRTAAFTTAAIRPQVNGVILKRLFVEGSEVKANQQLYQIDPAVYQAAYDSAVAALKRAQAGLSTDSALARRYKPLAAAQAVSLQDYDNALAAVQEDEANIDAAKAQVETAKINLNYTKVYSPIAGTIGASTVTPGALVTTDQANVLATVTQLDPMYVDVNEPINTWLRLKREAEDGQLELAPDGSSKVTLKLGDGSAYSLPGKMQFAEVNVDQATGTVLVRALFSNPQHLLLPGMYVSAVIDEGVTKDGILIPQQAVTRDIRGDAMVLLVNKDNVVVPQTIQVGQAMGADWEVTSGLKPGMRVIIAGLGNARPGAKVTPLDKTNTLDAPTLSPAS